MLGALEVSVSEEEEKGGREGERREGRGRGEGRGEGGGMEVKLHVLHILEDTENSSSMLTDMTGVT